MLSLVELGQIASVLSTALTLHCLHGHGGEDTLHIFLSAGRFQATPPTAGPTLCHLSTSWPCTGSDLYTLPTTR